MRASWCELFRHFSASSDIDPFEIRRRAGRAQVTQLHVLDLTDPAVQTALEIGDCDLVDDDYGGCQEIADAARMAGLDGVLAPSAGLAGERTLAVFTAALDRGAVTEQTGRVQVPPLDLVNVLGSVRPIPAAATAFRAFVTRLTRTPYEALRRQYRRR